MQQRRAGTRDVVSGVVARVSIVLVIGAQPYRYCVAGRPADPCYPPRPHPAFDAEDVLPVATQGAAACPIRVAFVESFHFCSTGVLAQSP